MFNNDLDPELQGTARRLASLAHGVTINPDHKAHLRQALARRHQELHAELSQRSATKFWPHLLRVKRLTLVAPPALAAAVVASLLVMGLQISGRQAPQYAEAQQVSHALERSAPTVKSWKVTTHQQSANVTTITRFAVQLAGDQELYIRPDRSTYRSYFFSGGRWSEVPDGATFAPSGAAWQFAFATLPQRLASRHVSILAHTKPGIIGFRYTIAGASGQTIVATAWIDRRTGLATRLERDVLQGRRFVSRDWADYIYQRTG